MNLPREWNILTQLLKCKKNIGIDINAFEKGNPAQSLSIHTLQASQMSARRRPNPEQWAVLQIDTQEIWTHLRQKTVCNRWQLNYNTVCGLRGNKASHKTYRCCSDDDLLLTRLWPCTDLHGWQKVLLAAIFMLIWTKLLIPENNFVHLMRNEQHYIKCTVHMIQNNCHNDYSSSSNINIKHPYLYSPLHLPARQGAIENVGVEKSAQSKMQGRKGGSGNIGTILQGWKMQKWKHRERSMLQSVN